MHKNCLSRTSTNRHWELKFCVPPKGNRQKIWLGISQRQELMHLVPSSRSSKRKQISRLASHSKFVAWFGFRNYHKPRCIYSNSAISQMKPPLQTPSFEDDTSSAQSTSQEVQHYQSMVKDRLHDSIEYSIYLCGMDALNHDDPSYDKFHCNPSLECDKYEESEFYVSRIQPKRLDWLIDWLQYP